MEPSPNTTVFSGCFQMSFDSPAPLTGFQSHVAEYVSMTGHSGQVGFYDCLAFFAQISRGRPLTFTQLDALSSRLMPMTQS